MYHNKKKKWITFTTRKNTVCWMVIRYLSKSSSKSDDKFCNSDWGPEATEAMCNEVRAYKVPGKDGKVLTLGDYIDRTPKELIVKVMLEEKVFDTWYCNRTVLLGDGTYFFFWHCWAKCIFETNPSTQSILHYGLCPSPSLCFLSFPPSFSFSQIGLLSSLPQDQSSRWNGRLECDPRRGHAGQLAEHAAVPQHL